MKALKVGLAGLGTVGGGTWNVCKKNAEEILKNISANMQKKYNIKPELIVEHGKKLEKILQVINKKSKNKIDNLVLGAALEGKGSNKLVNSLTLELTKNITIPVTIVPENVNMRKYHK